MLRFSAKISSKPTSRRGSRIVFPAAFFLFFLCMSGASFSANLYLTESGRLTDATPKQSIRYYLANNYVLEWHYQLRGTMAGGSYGYSIYAETTAQSDVSAYLEIILRSGSSEKVLAHWDRALWGSRGIQRFSGTSGGQQPGSAAGDVLVLRIGMNRSKYHEYGAIWVSDDYPSSITVPDIGNLTNVDMQNFRNELSVSQDQLGQVLSQQAETQRQLDSLTSTVDRLEYMMEELRDGLAQRRQEPEGLVEPEEEATPTPPQARLKFVPTLLELPAQADDLVVCMVKLDESHSVRDIDLDSLRLVGPSGTLKPDTDLCSFVNGNSAINADLRICFDAQKIGDLFAKNPGKTLFATLELNGEMSDGTALRGRGVIQIKRRAQQEQQQ